MNATTSRAGVGNKQVEKMMEELQRVADEIAAQCPEASDAALALIAAARYNDKTLVDAHYASLLSALVGVASDCIVRGVKASAATQEGLRKGWLCVTDVALELEELESLKNKVESVIEERMTQLLKVRRLVNSLAGDGYQVDEASELEQGISGLRQFRDTFLKRFPVSQSPSQLDHEYLAKAREDIKAGRNFRSIDGLAWRDMRPEKAV